MCFAKTSKKSSPSSTIRSRLVLSRFVKAIKDDLMVNTGKKPIGKKLEEARAKIFNNDTFKELMKPEFILKAYDSTFICVLLSMILNYFVKQEVCKESVKLFIDTIIENTNDKLEAAQMGGEDADINKQLLLSHPFTHRMVGCIHLDQKILAGILWHQQRIQNSNGGID